jgi:hypothetical protein
MTTTTTITFDRDAALRRKFDGGMPVHGDVDKIITARIRWVANHGGQERTCPRCTAHKGIAAAVCFTCANEIRRG